jgi:hypothetical protein
VVAPTRTGSDDVLDQPSRLPHSEAMSLQAPASMSGQRLAWPAAAAVIVVCSAALWGLIALAVHQLELI